MPRPLRPAILYPFADSVSERFHEWPMDKAEAAMEAGRGYFTPKQLSWLDPIATSLSIESDDFDYAPLSQKGGLG